MTAPDEDRWERYRAARDAPHTAEPKSGPVARRDRPANLRRGRGMDVLSTADDVAGLGWVGYGFIRLILGGVSGGTGVAAIWADGVATKVVMGAIAVGIVLLFYIARDASDEPRTTGEWAPPKDDRSKRRR